MTGPNPVNTAAGPALGIAPALRAVTDAAAIDAATPSQLYVTCFSSLHCILYINTLNIAFALYAGDVRQHVVK